MPGERTADGRRRVAKPRAEVRFDRFALFQIGHEFGLSAGARLLLVTLCLMRDWRDRTPTVRTHYYELAANTGISRGTISKQTLPELVTAGVVSVVSAFGNNHEGEVWILAWDRLVVPGRVTGVAENLANVDRRIDETSRTNRDAIVDFGANDLRRRPAPKEQGKEGRSGRSARATVAGRRTRSTAARKVERPEALVGRRVPPCTACGNDVDVGDDGSPYCPRCGPFDEDTAATSVEAEYGSESQPEQLSLSDVDQASDPYSCSRCSRPVIPAPGSVERGWATICGSCSREGLRS
jgi:hypothetical protein